MLEPFAKKSLHAEWLPPSAWPPRCGPLFVPGPFNPAVRYQGIPVIRNYADVRTALLDRSGAWRREVPLEAIPQGERHCTLSASWASDGETHKVLRDSLRPLNSGSSDEARRYTVERTRELTELLLAEPSPWDLARVMYQVSMELVILHTLQAPMLLPHAWKLRHLTREHVVVPGGFFAIKRQHEAEEILALVLEYKHGLPAGGLARKLVQLHDEGRISKDQLIGQLWLICVSQETQATAAASTIGMVLEHNLLSYAQKALADATATEWLVAEGLRRSIVFPASLLVSTRDLELNGYTITANTPCLVSYGAANIDPALFSANFAPGRAPTAPHLSFGIGTHYCQGKVGAAQFMEDVLAGTLPLLGTSTHVPNNRLLREAAGISLAVARLPIAA